MIARIWHGKTAALHLEEYSGFIEKMAIPDYSSVPGNRGIVFLRRLENDEAHFTLITYWDSIESIKKFAGEDYIKAKYYPEDERYLLEFEETVAHHEVFYQANLLGKEP
jgi:heme-degrading monooxygenase HmoA